MTQRTPFDLDLNHPSLIYWISQWLDEDLRSGDVTSWSTIPEPKSANAICVAKQDLVVCGLPVFSQVFHQVDAEIQVTSLVPEGASVSKGQEILSIKGDIHSILASERLGLNLLQHLSGIATQARAYADAVAGTKARVVDTRKTLPGLRYLQRYAVRVGGCHNHRYDLGAGILIKENHIRGAGSISAAVQSAQQHAPHTLRIEVGVTNLTEMEEAITAGADIVMLDNMTPTQITKAVSQAQGRAILEASGGITLDNVRDYANTGVDVISVGALTHSIQAADISLLVVPT